MSLRVDEGRRRARSKSPGRPADDRPERHERPLYDTRESSYAYAEDDLDDYPPRRRDRDDDLRSPPVRDSSGALPYPESTSLVMPGGFGDDDHHHPRAPRRDASPPPDSPYRGSRDKVDAREPRVRFPEHRDERPRGEKDELLPDADERFKFLPQKYSKAVERSDSRRRDDRDDDRRRHRDDEDDARRRRDDRDVDYRRQRGDEDDARRHRRDEYEESERAARRRDELDHPSLRPEPALRRDPSLRRDSSVRRDDDARRQPRLGDDGRPLSYRQASKAQMEDDLAYGALPEDHEPRRSMRKMLGFSKPEEELLDKFGYQSHGDGPGYPPPDRKSHRPAYEEDPRKPSSSMLTVEPGSRVRDSSRDRRGDRRGQSPQPPTGRMSLLSVDAAHPPNMSLSHAPPSPLLESYHGTYQQSSPMPSPMALAHPGAMEVSTLDLDDERSADEARINRRARFHHPEEIATRIAKALSGSHGPPDTNPLIQILPGLGHEEVMELRTQYKAIVKAGSQRKGVNVAKHIRSRLRDEDPNLMKACYAVALGRWEGEAYWANFWYQGDKTRRELLIEALMGRSNDEMREIKDGFRDKKYGDSLSKCMRTELKEDKFKKAVMLALSGERMEEEDEHGRPLELDMRLVDQDAEDLRRAVKSEKGGESQMISIVVLRSEAHLREVLREYSHQFKANFARDALKKSTNLVVSNARRPSIPLLR